MYSVIGADGQVYGPVDMTTLRTWIAEGRVTPDSNLIDPVDGRVSRARDLVLLQDVFSSAPPRSPYAAPPYGANLASNPYAAPMYPRPGMLPGQGTKSKVVAIVLALLLGGLGVHRFYLGHTGTGIAMLLITVLTCGYGGIITGIWALVDVVLIATDSLREANGLRLT